MKEKFKQVMSAEKDLKEIKDVLEVIKKYYEDISAKYSIKDDLVEITDKRRSLTQTLSEHTTKNDQKINIIIKKANKIIEEITELKTNVDSKISDYESFHKSIISLDELLKEEDEDGLLYKDKLLEILNTDNIEELISAKNKINTILQELTHKDGEKFDIVSEIQEMHEHIVKLNNDLFVSEDGKVSMFKKLRGYEREISKKYEKIVSGYTVPDEEKGEIEVKSYFDEIFEKRENFNLFYKKIFGGETEEDIGLEKSLDNQLRRFEEIETEARKIINLSSDAGLAGGFYQRGNKARNNKFISLSLFGLALISLAYFNFDTIKFDELDKITPTSIAIRLLINSPLVWLAIVANINLNKYARLEEEYAHKESLAKSFERYKEQIENLDDKEASHKLMEQLLETNITAFKKNAADTMLEAKSDMPMKNMGMKTIKSSEV